MSTAHSRRNGQVVFDFRVAGIGGGSVTYRGCSAAEVIALKARYSDERGLSPRVSIRPCVSK